MKRFDRDQYFQELRKKGYEIEKRIDSNGRLCGYTLGINATVIKASALGNGHNLLASKMESTWRNLHKNDINLSRPNPVPVTAMQRPVLQRPSAPFCTSQPNLMKPEIKPKSSIFSIKSRDNDLVCEIPVTIKDLFFDEAQLPEDVLWSTVEDVVHTAILLFCGYVDAATTVSTSCGGGGGGGDTKNWKRNKDEDDFAFARRCLNHARKMHARNRSLHR